MNTTIPVHVPGLGLLSVSLPAFSVGYALKELEDGSISVFAVMKTPRDESFASAYNRASRAFPGLAWERTTAFYNGLSDTGAAKPYWGARIVQTRSGGVKLIVKKDDPVLESYRALADRDPVQGAGFDSLLEVMTMLDIDPLLAEELASSSVGQEEGAAEDEAS